ncbi:MAG: hypothetical protein V3W34_03765 [Phycisphaerae bacterium]
MAVTASCTSSFDDSGLPGGFPWAFALAVLLVGSVEMVFRHAAPTSVIPYALGEAEYHAIAGYIDALGPADVAFIGSSRTREAIVAPQVRSRCEQELHTTVTVANYSCGGARADECDAIVKYALKKGTPRMILYGVAPRQLQGKFAYQERIALLWDLGDWWSEYRQDVDHVGDLLPIVIRNEIGRYYRTLKYRRKASTWFTTRLDTVTMLNDPAHVLTNLFRQGAGPCPVRGEITRWHRWRTRRLSSRPFSEDKIRQFVDRFVLEDRQYRIEPQRVEHMEAMMRRGREAGTKLVFFELPHPDIFTKHLPPDSQRSFLSKMHELADAGGAAFVTLDDLGLEFTPADFAEFAHLHYDGAGRLTAALVDRVILPHLRQPTRHASATR